MTATLRTLWAEAAARSREGQHTRDRYFVVPFAYRNQRNGPEFSPSVMIPQCTKHDTDVEHNTIDSVTDISTQTFSYPFDPRQVPASKKIFSLFGVLRFLERVHSSLRPTAAFWLQGSAHSIRICSKKSLPLTLSVPPGVALRDLDDFMHAQLVAA
jgi:hypothetical protein